MSAYFDTGVLAKVYCHESNSPDAIALLNQHSAPFLFTHFQELEIRTALRRKFFRGEIDAETLAGALKHIETDVEAGVLQRPVCDFGQVFRQAEKLSKDNAGKIGCRSLDILQVASALVVDAKVFISFDERQRKLAKEAGLKVKP